MRPPTDEQLLRTFHKKYGDSEDLYWGPKMRHRFGYFNPDDWYETVIDTLVTPDVRWLDVGSGRDTFPSNRQLAQELASRCRLMVGVDPDETILENPFVHERQVATIEDFQHSEKFDLITLRMVAEHIVDPKSAVASISKYAATGGRVVMYTVNKYSPVPLFTRIVPFGARHAIKRLLWGTEEKDTFPTAFRLNTRRTINEHMASHGLIEDLFLKLDDCRSFARWKATLFAELAMQRMLRSVRIPYPENCLLTVHRRP